MEENIADNEQPYILTLELVAERVAKRLLHLNMCTDVPAQVLEVGNMIGRLEKKPDGTCDMLNCLSNATKLWGPGTFFVTFISLFYFFSPQRPGVSIYDLVIVFVFEWFIAPSTSVHSTI